MENTSLSVHADLKYCNYATLCGADLKQQAVLEMGSMDKETIDKTG